MRSRFAALLTNTTGRHAPASHQIEDLKAEVAELRERLSAELAQSSLPPSSDQFSHQRKLEKQPQAACAALNLVIQVMAAGSSWQQRLIVLLSSDQSDAPNAGNYCWAMTRPKRHQVSEIPPAKAEVTEYRRHILCCLHAGAKNQAQWPEQMPKGASALVASHHQLFDREIGSESPRYG